MRSSLLAKYCNLYQTDSFKFSLVNLKYYCQDFSLYQQWLEMFRQQCIRGNVAHTIKLAMSPMEKEELRSSRSHPPLQCNTRKRKKVSPSGDIKCWAKKVPNALRISFKDTWSIFDQRVFDPLRPPLIDTELLAVLYLYFILHRYSSSTLSGNQQTKTPLALWLYPK